MKYLLILFIYLSNISFACSPKVGDFFEGCEGEGCHILRYRKAVKSIRIYEKPNLSSPVVDKLARCEKFASFKPMLLTNQVGYGHLKVDTFMDRSLNGSKGKKFEVIQELGEGFFKVCIEGKIHEVDIAEISTDKKVKNESWIKIKTPRGKVGYARGNRPFYMGVFNYDSTLLCPEDRKSKAGNIKVSEVELTNLEKRNQGIFLKKTPSRWDGEYYHIEKKTCYKVFRKGANIYQKKSQCSKKILNKVSF